MSEAELRGNYEPGAALFAEQMEVVEVGRDLHERHIVTLRGLERVGVQVSLNVPESVAVMLGGRLYQRVMLAIEEVPDGVPPPG